jgi:2-oxoglutarate ferredoxin oxidoreductase subunit delta
MVMAVAPRVSWTGEPVIVDTGRCKGCELCVAACPHASLALDLDTVNPLGHHPVALVDPSSCTSCAFCARVCPDAVLTVLAPPKGVDP